MKPKDCFFSERICNKILKISFQFLQLAKELMENILLQMRKFSSDFSHFMLVFKLKIAYNLRDVPRLLWNGSILSTNWLAVADSCWPPVAAPWVRGGGIWCGAPVRLWPLPCIFDWRGRWSFNCSASKRLPDSSESFEDVNFERWKVLKRWEFCKIIDFWGSSVETGEKRELEKEKLSKIMIRREGKCGNVGREVINWGTREESVQKRKSDTTFAGK